ncbi:ribonuclease Oy-like [Acropora palmata]|uniref:ribonuclease Oy-like n=1 Tax=Acropora palmata TaxID=6131 RepID=UPI003DA08A80
MLMQVFVLALLCRTAASFNFYRSEYGANFDHFVFTQWWPQTQCLITYRDDYRTLAESSLNKNCVPEGITKWTIHGLWPTEGMEHKPVWCNSSWPFDESVIEDLRPKLEKQWRSYEEGHEDVEFWAHEWEKHGTCCTNLPYLNTEHKYFNVTLDLNKKFDVYSALKLRGIMPSNKWIYQVKDIEDALDDYFQVTTTVYCYRKMLSYVELCLDKQLRLINCPRTTSNCEYESVLYPPIVPV